MPGDKYRDCLPDRRSLRGWNGERVHTAVYTKRAKMSYITGSHALSLGTHIWEGISNVYNYTNPSNIGYLRSCNTAALVASGEFLLLLNNDTQVLPGWLDAQS